LERAINIGRRREVKSRTGKGSDVIEKHKGTTQKCSEKKGNQQKMRGKKKKKLSKKKEPSCAILEDKRN